MSDTNAAATLSLEISTQEAQAQLDALERKYAQLLTLLKSKEAGLTHVVSPEASAEVARLKTAIVALNGEIDALKVGATKAGAAGQEMGKQLVSGIQAGAGSFSLRTILKDDQIAALKSQFGNLGKEAAASLEKGLTNQGWTKSNNALALLEQNTVKSLGRVKTLIEEANRAFVDFGPDTARAKYGDMLLDKSFADSVETLRQVAHEKATVQAEEAAKDRAFLADARARAAEWNKLNQLNERGYEAEQLKKNLAERDRVLAEEAAKDRAFLADARARAAEWNKLRADEAKWAMMSDKQRASATLQAARAYYSGASQDLLPGAAGSKQALDSALSAGSVDKANKALEALTGSAKNLSPAVQQATAHQLHWNKAANEAHALARGLSGSLGTLWITYGSLIPLMAGAALGSGFVQAAKQGSEFAYQLTFVKALGEESAAAIESLSKSALDLGKNSLQGPGEIASGFRILAQAGLAASDALKVMPDAMHLATVGEMNMEQAATTLVGVMNAFSLSVKDSTHVGDIFAKAAALSQTSVQAMTESMKTASVVGEQYGASIEDTATALTLLAKVNITGTAAGTSMRNMLKELYTPVPQAAAAIKKLGLETKDAAGNMRPFPEIIYDLKEKLKDFDKAGQTQILQRIFGERGAKEAIVMLSKTREEWEALKASISNSDGFMGNVSKALEDEVKGKWAQALNSLQAQLISAYQEMAPTLGKLADSFKDLFNSEGFTKDLKSIVSGMASLTQTMVSLAPVLVEGAKLWVTYKAAMIGAALWTSASAAVSTFASSVLAASGALGPALSTMATMRGIVGGLPSLLLAVPAPMTAIAGLLAAGATAWVLWGGRATEAIDNAKRRIDSLQSAISDVNALFDSLKFSGKGDADAFLTVSNKALAQQSKAYDDIKAALNSAGLRMLNSQADLNKKFSFNYSTSEITDQDGKRYTASMFKQSETLQSLISKFNQANKASVEAKAQADKMFAEADAQAVNNAKRETARGKKRDVDEILGKDDKKEANEAYREDLASFKRYSDSYEQQYKTFVEATKEMYANKNISELAMLEANGQARLATIDKQIAEENKAIARARAEGKGADVEEHEKNLTALQAARVRAEMSTDTDILNARQSFSDSMRKIDLEYMGKSESEVAKAQTKLTGEWAKLMNEALLNNDQAAVERLNALKNNLLNVADFKDKLDSVKLIVSDVTTQVSSIEAEMGRDGGWVSRILGSSTIVSVIADARAKIEPEMDKLRQAMVIGDADAEKQYLALRRQYDKLANYVPEVWKDITKNIDSTVHSAFSKIFTKGKTDWKSFGKSIADDLKTALLDALYQAFVRKWVFNIIANVSQGAGWSALATIASNVAGESGGGGGSGGSYLGMASNASTAYNLYTGSTASAVGSGINYIGNATGSTYLASYGAGFGMSTAQANAAAQIYQAAALAAQTSAAEAATLEASQALLAEAASYQAAADGLGASASVSSASFAWPIAAAVGMYMSSQAWKSGIRANGNWSNPDDPTTWAEHPRDIEYKVLSALFGKDFAGSEFVAVTLGNSLQKFTQQAIWGERSYQYNGQRLAGGFSDEGFAGQLGTNYKQKGGIFTSTKEKTDWQDVPAQLGLALDIVYAGVKSGFVTLGKKLGDDTMPEILRGFNMSFSGPVDSLFQVSADAEKQLTEAMGKLLFPAIAAIAGKADSQLGNLNEQLKYAQSRNDTAAADALKTQIEAAKKVADETWNQTFQRVVAEGDAVMRVLDLMGLKLTEVFAAGNANNVLKLSDSLVGLFGSVDALNTAFSSYYSNFYSKEEQQAQAWQDMRAAFDNLGLAMPTTRDGFRNLVQSLDLSTTAGQGTFKALMDVQQAFANLTPTAADFATSALQSATQATDAAFAAVKRAITAEQQAAQARLDAANEQKTLIEDLISTLKSNLADLYGSVTGNSTQLVAQARGFIDQSLATARSTGYLPDSSDLADAISTVRGSFSSDNFASAEDMARAQLQLAGQLSELQGIAQPQLSAAETAVALAQDQLKALDKQLSEVQAQVDALRKIDTSVLSVTDAITKLQTAVVTELQTQTSALVSAILSNLKSGTVTSTTAGTQLTSTGVPVDTKTTVNTLSGTSDVFVSSKGAVAVDGTLKTTNGWSGSIDSAKSIIYDAYSTSSAEQFRAAAVGVGLSAAMIDNLYGLAPGTANQWAAQNNLPAFAKGTAFVPNDMTAQIHQGEIIIDPRSSDILRRYGIGVSGGSDPALLSELQALREEVVRLQGLVNQTNENTRRTASAVNGNPEAPILVEVV